MRRQEAWAKQQVVLVMEGQRMPPVEHDPPRVANVRQHGLDRIGIDRLGRFPRQPQQYGAVAMVPPPGQRQRTEQLGLDPVRDQPGVEHLSRKGLGRAHRPHRMRARRTNADGEKLGHADCGDAVVRPEGRGGGDGGQCQDRSICYELPGMTSSCSAR